VPIGICEGAGLVKRCSGACGRGRVSVAEIRYGGFGVPHQGVVLRDGSGARHLSAPEGMVRSGHDRQGLNQFVDVATGVGVMPIPSRLRSCPSFTRRLAA
jgi:hypothetical protein